MVLAEDGQQVRSDGGQDVAHLVVGGAGLGGEPGDDGAEVAAENLAEDLLAVLDVDAHALACVAAQRLYKCGCACGGAGVLLHGTQEFGDGRLDDGHNLAGINVEFLTDFTDHAVAGEGIDDTG